LFCGNNFDYFWVNELHSPRQPQVGEMGRGEEKEGKKEGRNDTDRNKSRKKKQSIIQQT
jgi:hypothetical protein